MRNTDLAAYVDANVGKYGSVFTIFIPKPMVVLADYDSIKAAFIKTGSTNCLATCQN